MLVVLVTWIMMIFLFGTVGIAVNCLIKKYTKYEKNTVFDMIWWGIIFSTVYAQFFSLFTKIGMLAIAMLSALAILCLVLFRDEYTALLKTAIYNMKRNPKTVIWGIAIGSVISFCGLIATLQEPQHYDTYLYHAQNIRWLEEYGIVKGLGNLHNRFAYNSSFMCLQALFSFSWCLEKSQHTVNGFLWIFMMIYAVMTLKCLKHRKLFVSDIFKVLIVMYLVNEEVFTKVSSPHTDEMTMLLVAYIITRWFDLLEEREKGYFPYGCLCLLGVFAVSAKLSAAFILILVLKPAIALIREKRWLSIWGFIGSGVIIIMPFIIRNIIISGYLVYPYADVDLFNFDWEMPASTVIFDNHEIIAWGRGLRDVKRYAEPITTWFPVWIENANAFNVFLMILNIALLILSVVVLGLYLRKKKFDDVLTLGCLVILFLGWLFTAPLLRYGLIYLYVIPLYYLGIILKKADNILQSEIQWKYLYGVVVLLICFLPVRNVFNENSWLLQYCTVYPMDYCNTYEIQAVKWEEMDIYIPVNGDQTSYDVFPAIPYVQRLEVIELRGNDLGEGFRIKEAYKGKKLNTYGNVWE